MMPPDRDVVLALQCETECDVLRARIDGDGFVWFDVEELSAPTWRSRIIDAWAALRGRTRPAEVVVRYESARRFARDLDTHLPPERAN